MVSAQIPGSYAIYIENPSGQRRLVKSAGSYWWALSGSVDGVVGTTNTPEKWNYLPLSTDTGGSGYKIVVTVTAGAAATADASDAFWAIPVQVNGAAQMIGNPAHASGLGNNNFTVDYTPADTAFVASVETPFAVIRAKEGVNFKVGGDRVFMTVENNA